MRWGGRPQTARPNHCAVRPRSESCLPEPARYVTGTGRVPEKTRRLQRRDKAILAPAATTYTCCAAKDPTGLEHPGKLEHRRSGVRQAMQPVESQRQVKGVVRERQTRDIGLGELHQVGHAEPSGPTACPSQHVRGNVSGHITAILPGAQSAKGEPSAAWDVQHIGARGAVPTRRTSASRSRNANPHNAFAPTAATRSCIAAVSYNADASRAARQWSVTCPIRRL